MLEHEHAFARRAWVSKIRWHTRASEHTAHTQVAQPFVMSMPPRSEAHARRGVHVDSFASPSSTETSIARDVHADRSVPLPLPVPHEDRSAVMLMMSSSSSWSSRCLGLDEERR